MYNLFIEEHMNLNNIGFYYRAYCSYVHKLIMNIYGNMDKTCKISKKIKHINVLKNTKNYKYIGSDSILHSIVIVLEVG